MTDLKFRYLYSFWKDAENSPPPLFMLYQECMMFAVRYPDGSHSVDHQVPGCYLDGGLLDETWAKKFTWEK